MSMIVYSQTWYDAFADFSNDDISYDVFDQFGIFKPRAMNLAHILSETKLISNELHASKMEMNQQTLDRLLYRHTSN